MRGDCQRQARLLAAVVSLGNSSSTVPRAWPVQDTAKARPGCGRSEFIQITQTAPSGRRRRRRRRRRPSRPPPSVPPGCGEPDGACRAASPASLPPPSDSPRAACITITCQAAPDHARSDPGRVSSFSALLCSCAAPRPSAHWSIAAPLPLLVTHPLRSALCPRRSALTASAQLHFAATLPPARCAGAQLAQTRNTCNPSRPPCAGRRTNDRLDGSRCNVSIAPWRDAATNLSTSSTFRGSGGGVGVGVSVDDMGWIEERRTDYQSAFRSSFFFARNMLKRAFVLMSLTPRFTSSLAVGLGSALPR